MLTTVLVAEDEPMIAMAVIDELSEAGFLAIGPFATTSQALAYCREHTPDCAVLDVRLEDGESFPLADLLAQRAVPVVFHSGHAAPRDLTQRYPGVRICPKPAAVYQLAGIVAEISPRV
jgi:DNA-binding response OmpR family regulator